MSNYERAATFEIYRMRSGWECEITLPDRNYYVFAKDEPTVDPIIERILQWSKDRGFRADYPIISMTVVEEKPPTD